MPLPIAAIVATIPQVTDALNKVAAIFKGKTQHPSYDAVNSVAQSLSEKWYSIFFNSYGEQGVNSIAREVRPLFLNAMKSTWGLDIPLNQTIAKDITANLDFKRQLWLFIVWVGTNIDVNRPETFNQYVDGLFRQIFVQATSNAGFDVSTVATVNPSQPSEGTPSSDWLAKAFQGKTLLVIAVIVAAYFLVLKKKKGG